MCCVVAVRGADDGEIRTCVVAESVAAHRRLRRARARQPVQVWPAPPAIRPDHGGGDLLQQRHLAGPRRVYGSDRHQDSPPRPQRVRS